MRTATCLAVFVAMVAVAAGAKKVSWSGFYATWSGAGAAAYESGAAFFDLPDSTSDARADGWERVQTERLVSLWCRQKDPRVCLLFDKWGHIAGVQMGYPAEDLDRSPYEWRKHSQFKEYTIFGKKVGAGRFYLVPQSTLILGGRLIMSEIGSGVWIQDGDKFNHVPQDATKLSSAWTEGNCVPYMGRHYYYNVSTTMDCQNFEPFFLVVDNQNDWLMGMGFQSFGNRTSEARNWEENIPATAIKTVLPPAPDCLVNWAADYGLLSMHVFLVPQPYSYTCDKK